MLEILPPILVSMMIGNVSGDASPQVLAGSSLSDFFQGQITSSLLMGLGAAVATLCAQSYGADQPRQFWIFAQAGLLASLYCLPPLAVVSVNGASLMTALGQEQELAHVAGVLITVSLFSVPFQMIYMVARSALQAQNIAVPFVLVSLLSYMVSLPIGYYLGYHTSLGYVGIALSNMIANVLRAASVGPILLRNPLFRESWPGWQWHDAHACVKRLWPLIAGSVLLIVFQSAGFFAISVLCGYLPHAAVAMASNNIASGLLSLGFLPMMGLAAGGTVRVGNALGAGAPRRASVTSLVVVTESLVISLAGMAMMHGVATPYAAAFTSDNATLALTVQLTEYLIKVVPLVACVYATQSVFQACGAQWLCAKLNFLFMFAIGVPLGLVWALPWHGGVYGLWNGNMVAGATLVAVGIAWVARIDWPAMAHEARCNAHLHVDREPSPELKSTASSTYVLE
jgi:multidrug resistance protein, MATE family